MWGGNFSLERPSFPEHPLPHPRDHSPLMSPSIAPATSELLPLAARPHPLHDRGQSHGDAERARSEGRGTQGLIPKFLLHSLPRGHCHRLPARPEHRAASRAGAEPSWVLSKSRPGQAPKKPGITYPKCAPKHRGSHRSPFGLPSSASAAASLRASGIDSFQRGVSTAPRARPSCGESLAFCPPRAGEPRLSAN